MTQTRRWIIVFAAILAIIATVWAFYWLPTKAYSNPQDAMTFRGQLIAFIGICATTAVAVFGIKKHYLDKERQQTDAYLAAIGNLSATDPVIKAGGVRALTRMMSYSVDDSIRVLETLADILRYHTPGLTIHDLRNNTRPEITAALAALLRRKIRPSEPALDLAGIQLPGAQLDGLVLPRARLMRTDLTEADLRRTTLTEAHLGYANLSRAELAGSTLTGADLHRALLAGADLTDTTLHHADLTDAVLTGTDLRGVDLRTTRGLTAEQVAAAHTDTDTRLPTPLR